MCLRLRPAPAGPPVGRYQPWPEPTGASAVNRPVQADQGIRVRGGLVRR
jgi:hypothetical protein